MIDFYDAKIEYDLKELENEFFEAVKVLKSLTFIDSEEYVFQAQNIDCICISTYVHIS